MREFVRQQIRHRAIGVRVGQVALRNAVRTRLMVLDAVGRNRIAERDQEVIVRPVARAEKPVGLRDERLPAVDLCCGRIDVARRFTEEIDFVRHPVRAGQRHDAFFVAAVERRIDQRLKRDGREPDGAARLGKGRLGAREGKRRRLRPARRKHDRCGNHHVVHRSALRCEDDLVPIENADVRGHIAAARRAFIEIVGQIDARCACGDREMKRPEIVCIARPRNGRARCGRAHHAEVPDLAGRRVIPRFPLRKDERYCAARCQRNV